jgi:4-alpha-glucanotransferase
MKLKFSIHYITNWGLHLAVKLSYFAVDGEMIRSQLADMTTDDGEMWTTETSAIQPRNRRIEFFEYSYIVVDENGKILREEWNKIPRRYYIDTMKDYVMPDSWRDIPDESYLYSSAYSTAKKSGGITFDCIRFPLFRHTILFRVSAPQLAADEQVGLIGSHPVLGNWSEGRFMSMTYCGGYEWMLALNVDNVTLPLEYKYVVTQKNTNKFIAWEGGENRVTVDKLDDGQVLIAYGEHLRIASRQWRASGISIPLFSLKSEHSYGVGDFGDLKRLVDWAKVTGMTVIQLLPLNDTTTTRGWTDSYPYNIISAFAIHPHYIDIEELGELSEGIKMKSFHKQQKELNSLKISDYEAVARVKEAYVREYFKEYGDEIIKSDDYLKFFDDNASWLKAYAAFRMLRDKYGTARFSDWKSMQHYDSVAVDKLFSQVSDERNEMIFFCFVQYLLYRQFNDAARYARSVGVVLMGDLPIGISRDSVETWVHPELFNLDSQTGTPPDRENRVGQNWNFPTYNWNVMMNDRCQWMRNRLKWMEKFFDALRIDHILGFFRVWEIPIDAVQGVLGHFSPAIPLSPGEIEHYGLTFRQDMYTKPMINDDVLRKIFGIHAQYVKDTFLDKVSYGMYELKEIYNTQVKVRDYFGGRNDENSVWIRDGLYRLIADVLFVEDPHQRGMFHPRINAYNEPIYQALGDDEKESFMRLYDNFYYQRHNDFWRNEAFLHLPTVLSETSMLICAEDLGMLPECVEPTLSTLKILTTEIQRMPKNSNYDFAHLDENPYRSVVTTSTHDMSPLRLWWEEDNEHRQLYYVTMLQKEGRPPLQLPAWLAEEIVKRHMYSNSMLCILPFQDWMSIDQELRNPDVHAERINVPSDCYNRWGYRMHITLERLMEEKRYNDKIRNIIMLSRRK